MVPSLDTLIVVATHHKAGTVWLLDIFKEIAVRTGRNLFNGAQPDIPEDAHIFFQEHSRVDLNALQCRFPNRKIVGTHIIRDPRDIVVSATHYHMKSGEAWLHEPLAEFDGLTYQQKINSLPTDIDRFVFEMDHSSKWTILAMEGWNYGDARIFELRYENLIVDTELKIFRELFKSLGFAGALLDLALGVAYQKSLFSGNKVNKNHVRSGKAGQWSNCFTENELDEFNRRFPAALLKLGYE